jgi:hypothetical protein
MPVTLIRAQTVDPALPTHTPIWLQLVLFGGAGLLVSALVMSYGVNLSPGFF